MPFPGPNAGATPRAVPAEAARRVLLRRHLLAGAGVRSSAAAVLRVVERLGFVQVDSISRIERAHHLIAGTRLVGYRAEHLARAIERDRTLFEHWTHDASVIPIGWLAHWKRRFARHRRSRPATDWWRERFGGRPEATLRRVRGRIEREGPLRSRDFAPPEGRAERGGWWSWHPEKAALEHLWRCGELAIVRREGFEKVYDLFDRAYPQAASIEASDEASHRDWACRAALSRLGIATPREIAGFLAAISLADANRWCADALRRGEVEAVRVERADGGAPIAAFAEPGWERDAAPIDGGMRVLCPFDPAIRDRTRTERLFGFRYRFEAFTPAARRVYGYYACPLLDGDALVGRIDPHFDRGSGVLQVRCVWWEASLRREAARARRLDDALAALAALVGADEVRLER